MPRGPVGRATVAVVLGALLAGGAAACSDDADRERGDVVAARDGERMLDAPRNPYLADSSNPIGHGTSAQADSTSVPGPTGPTATLDEDELTYRHLGPGHFGIAISSPDAAGRRVIWSNGRDRISKVDHDTLEVLAELPIGDEAPQPAAAADEGIAELDDLEGRALADAGVRFAGQYLAGLAGVYYALDADGTFFVGGADSVVAYGDRDAGERTSPIVVTREWARPPEVTGAFVGVNMTFDGQLVLVTEEGWVVVVERDFSAYDALQLPGAAEEAAAHNQAMLAAGHRPGAASWVRNSAAVDEDGGIHVASLDEQHKVVWDGERLSVDPGDGAWSAPFANGTGIGTGATPSLMGFGDEDRFVVITDGEPVMNLVLYWRDEIPEDWQQLPGTADRRIAGVLPADMGDPDRTAIQTEQSAVVGGYGALVVDNEPASVPDGFPPAAVRVLAGYAGAEPAFTPHGLQKFEWDPDGQRLQEAWFTTEVSSANAVPLLSTGSGTVYTVGARDGGWTLEGVDWVSGASTFHQVTGSSRYNTLFSGMNLDEDGRVIHTTMFGIVRYER